jgi:hypothetical protein
VASPHFLLLLLALLRMRSRKRRAERRKARRAQRVETVVADPSNTDATTPIDELPQVTAYPMPVIGLIEERVFDELEDIASQSIMGHRVLTQLSLSAFLYAGSSGLSRADEQRVTAHLASLQVDFLIVDADWRPGRGREYRTRRCVGLGRAGSRRRYLRARGRSLFHRECRWLVRAAARGDQRLSAAQEGIAAQ